jgi:hypothetical protein
VRLAATVDQGKRGFFIYLGARGVESPGAGALFLAQFKPESSERLAAPSPAGAVALKASGSQRSRMLMVRVPGAASSSPATAALALMPEVSNTVKAHARSVNLFNIVFSNFPRKVLDCSKSLLGGLDVAVKGGHQRTCVTHLYALASRKAIKAGGSTRRAAYALTLPHKTNYNKRFRLIRWACLRLCPINGG